MIYVFLVNFVVVRSQQVLFLEPILCSSAIQGSCLLSDFFIGKDFTVQVFWKSQKNLLFFIKLAILFENIFKTLSFQNRKSQGTKPFRECSPPTTFHKVNSQHYQHFETKTHLQIGPTVKFQKGLESVGRFFNLTVQNMLGDVCT